MTALLSYHNDPELKAATIATVKAHRDADRLVQGTGAEGEDDNFRGCAVGCTIGEYDHAAYEDRIGVPAVLAQYEDAIFEGLPGSEALDWPVDFLQAVPVGANLRPISHRFAAWMLRDSNLLDLQEELTRDASLAIAALHDRDAAGETVTEDEWSAAESAAWSAARSASESASESAAGSAAEAAAWATAWSAAWSAADSAWSAAESAAWSAAESAARSALESASESAAGSAAWATAWSAADSAWSAADSAWSAAKSAAKSAAYRLLRDKLLEMLREAA